MEAEQPENQANQAQIEQLSLSEDAPAVTRPARKVQVVGDLPPAPRFSADEIAEARAARPNGSSPATSDQGQDQSAATNKEGDEDDDHDDEEDDGDDDGREDEDGVDDNDHSAAQGTEKTESEEEKIDDATLLDKFAPDETVCFRLPSLFRSNS